MLYELILLLIIFLYGIVIGSFLNVCIFRIPKKENIATIGSHCMSCNHSLKWYDLVPLMSWLCLGGKCRYCRAKISVQYPLIEAINGFGYVLIFCINGYNVDSILLALMFSALVVLSVIDLRTFEIPPQINLFILGIGIIRAILDYENIVSHLIGLVCISGFLLLLIVVTNGRAMGGGDVKLMAAAGLVLGAKQIILAFFLGCIIGSVIHLIIMKVCNKGNQLAFGPYLSAGIVIAMLFGNQMTDWYFSLF